MSSSVTAVHSEAALSPDERSRNPGQRSRALRSQIEAALAHRVPAALTPLVRSARPVRATGVAAIDDLLLGGVPAGGITELLGAGCSGRTSLALSLMGSITRAGQVGAWVDGSDALVPSAAAANGVLLDRMLWVRCSSGVKGDDTLPFKQGGSAGVQVVRLAELTDRPQSGGCGSPHPRSEVKGLSAAIEGLLAAGEGAVPALFTREASERQATIRRERVQGKPGTPGAKNWSVGAHGGIGANGTVATTHQGARTPGLCTHGGTICTNGIMATVSPSGRVEQVAYDRLPARRGERMLRTPGLGPGSAPELPSEPRGSVAGPAVLRQSPLSGEAQISEPRSAPAGGRVFKVQAKKPWGRLEQAIRVVDLLVQGGGFGAIVLDLGGIAPEFVRRIPLATWFRWRAAVERTQASLVVLAQASCAGSSAELTMRLGLACMPAAGTVMEGVRYVAEVLRRRFGEQADAPVVSIDRVSRAGAMAGMRAGLPGAAHGRKPPASVRVWQTRAAWAGQPGSSVTDQNAAKADGSSRWGRR